MAQKNTGTQDNPVLAIERHYDAPPERVWQAWTDPQALSHWFGPGEDNSVTGGVIGAVTLLAVNWAVARFVFAHPTLERVVEGAPTVLIENGQVQEAGLRRELITLAEVEAAAHRQGFDSLREVDRAVLEPAGVISFVARKPSVETLRHEELLRRLEDLGRELGALRAAVAARP